LASLGDSGVGVGPSSSSLQAVKRRVKAEKVKRVIHRFFI